MAPIRQVAKIVISNSGVRGNKPAIQSPAFKPRKVK